MDELTDLPIDETALVADLVAAITPVMEQIVAQLGALVDRTRDDINRHLGAADGD
jgi:hypothetical protein